MTKIVMKCFMHNFRNFTFYSTGPPLVTVFFYVLKKKTCEKCCLQFIIMIFHTSKLKLYLLFIKFIKNP